MAIQFHCSFCTATHLKEENDCSFFLLGCLECQACHHHHCHHQESFFHPPTFSPVSSLLTSHSSFYKVVEEEEAKEVASSYFPLRNTNNDNNNNNSSQIARNTVNNDHMYNKEYDLAIIQPIIWTEKHLLNLLFLLFRCQLSYYLYRIQRKSHDHFNNNNNDYYLYLNNKNIFNSDIDNRKVEKRRLNNNMSMKYTTFTSYYYKLQSPPISSVFSTGQVSTSYNYSNKSNWPMNSIVDFSSLTFIPLKVVIIITIFTTTVAVVGNSRKTFISLIPQGVKPPTTKSNNKLTELNLSTVTITTTASTIVHYDDQNLKKEEEASLRSNIKQMLPYSIRSSKCNVTSTTTDATEVNQLFTLQNLFFILKSIIFIVTYSVSYSWIINNNNYSCYKNVIKEKEKQSSNGNKMSGKNQFTKNKSMKLSSLSKLIRRTFTLLMLIIFTTTVKGDSVNNHKELNKLIMDPRVITYPGDLNFALFVDGHESIHSSSRNGKVTADESSDIRPLQVPFGGTSQGTTSMPLECSSKINSDGVLKAMSAIWAAHQVNIRRSRSKDSDAIKIGVSVFDACSSPIVIQRQSVRMISSSLFASPSSGTGTASLSNGKLCQASSGKAVQPTIFGMSIHPFAFSTNFFAPSHPSSYVSLVKS